MNVRLRLYVILSLQLLLQIVGSSLLTLEKRVSSDDPLSFDNYRGAVLVINGSQTSCEFAIINNSYAFIAANCLADDSGALDTGRVYQIYFNDAGNQTPVKATIPKQNVHIHPSYDPSTFANNIAVVSFDGIPGDGWRSSTGITPDEWSGRWFVRRYLNDVNSMAWNTPIIETHRRESSVCPVASGLYAANTDNMYCSTATLPAMFGAPCSIPYSVSYAVVDQQMAPAALYSHSVYYGDDMCNSPKKRLHYYTLLQNYIAFAESITGYQIFVLPDHHDHGFNTDPNFSMNAPSFGLVDGTHIYSKNYFTETNTAEVPTSSNTSSGTGSTNTGSTNTGSTTGTTAGTTSGSTTGSNTTSNSGSSSGSTSGSGTDSGSNSGSQNSSQGSSSNDSNGSGDSSNNGSSNNSDSAASASGNNDASENNNSGNGNANGSGGDSNSSKSGISGGIDGETSDSGELGGFTFAADGEFFSDTGLHTITQTISGSETVMVVTATRISIAGVRPTTGVKDAINLTADDASDDSGGLKHGQVVGLAIAMTIIGLGLIVAGVFGARWYRKRTLNNRWSQNAVQQMVESQTVENEIGIANPARYDLPTYRNHQETQFIAAGLNTPRTPSTTS
ncbi:hypothetical protein LPJ53_003649 [Coemansia erecta]|uniref:Peptidase S1 domain-containing protein n=1 Tax=Coemansia erecta TaxID=147472 RepID=A0A9W8CQL6_9FUNG|nr:hypothetical protein LPJ53_003649 [Coemansia erecta]